MMVRQMLYKLLSKGIHFISWKLISIMGEIEKMHSNYRQINHYKLFNKKIEQLESLNLKR